MQDVVLEEKKIRISRINELCENGEYGKALEAWMNTQMDLGQPLLMGNFVSDFLAGWSIGESINTCCCEPDGCGTYIGGCCGLLFCGLCCFTVIDGGDIAQNFCSWGTNCCENACERTCCD